MSSSAFAVLFATALTMTSVNNSNSTVPAQPVVSKHDAEREARAEEVRRKINERLDMLERKI